MYTFNKIASFVLVVMVIVALPLYTSYYILPSYGAYLVSTTEKSMVDVAGHITSSLAVHSRISPDTPLPYEFTAEIEHIKNSINLWKVKVFSPGGEIVYSSTSKDVGNMTKKAFFPDIIEKGQSRSRIDKREVLSQSGKPSYKYLLECYVPIIREGTVIGVFEIYYDITQASERLRLLEHRYHTILFGAGVALLLALLMRLSNRYFTPNND